MKKYTLDLTAEFTLSILRQNQSQKKLIEMKQKLKHLSFKIVRNTQWSDLTDDQQFNDLMKKISKMIFKTLIEKRKFKIYRQNRLKNLQSKKLARKRVRSVSSNLRLIKKNAKRVITEKLQKEKETKKRKLDVNFMRIWRMKRDEMHAKKVAIRRIEKARVKQLKKLQKNINIISNEMFQSIHDLEIKWKTTNLIWLTQQEVKKNKSKRSRVRKDDDDEEMKFQINLFQSSFLTENFISFEEDNDDDEIARHTRNAKYAKHMRHVEHENYDLAEHDINAEFLFEDFFNRMYNE